MLVLTRKLSERILIGDDITVMVAEIRGGKVRLAIDAPRSTTILRSEIAEAAVDSGTIAQGRDKLDLEENQ